jgi:hypothetical protein
VSESSSTIRAELPDFFIDNRVAECRDLPDSSFFPDLIKELEVTHRCVDRLRTDLLLLSLRTDPLPAPTCSILGLFEPVTSER